MKNIYFLAALFFLNSIFAQNKEESNQKLITNTLNGYIEGSSYNNRELIKSAFVSDATLYLTTRSGFQKLTVDQYTNFFSPERKGKFNGRIGKVLDVTIFEDIAQAKVEIFFSKSKIVYIDLFLLKQTPNGWKIISKTATRLKESPKKEKVLFIVSNAHFYGNTELRTGNSFSEIVNAYDVFTKNGYEVNFVSPKGGAIPLAYINTSDELSKKYVYTADFMNKLKTTLTPSQINTSEYKAVQYIGGGSVMFDVPQNKEIANIVMEIYEKHNGIISSVCHGTAGIVNLKTSNGEYLVKNKRVNGYPDDYERKDRPYFKTFPFLIKKTIEERGGVFKFSKPNTPHVEVDGRLITGQNYKSSKPVSEKIISLLSENIK
ncbi:Putative intracellular protease/amidase [Tenacibaculum sp. MAR_2009_124]|uniref:nuclear transport factor 2 family protein n=1 Tax=Tenacibaculum sp. MAR_2009_124 TaxID=1250059 RepID=UPI000895C9EC|nr:nuclear transport factor 2 family protein [Tenacibaculum sp. MAR_2009_124]SEB44524.1 Putative intracellular protease/amidase [Tenacibaculum sp. MAR_2009_124]